MISRRLLLASVPAFVIAPAALAAVPETVVTRAYDQSRYEGTFVSEVHAPFSAMLEEIVRETGADSVVVSPTGLTIVQSAMPSCYDLDTRSRGPWGPSEMPRVGTFAGASLLVNKFASDSEPARVYRSGKEVGLVSINTRTLSFL